jgi:hypothetical protein
VAFRCPRNAVQSPSSIWNHASSFAVTSAYAAVAALGGLLAASPIVGAYFHDDDFLHLFQLANYGPREFITAPYGGHMYLVRNSVFFLTFRFFGMRATAYLASALATHVANVLLLFGLVRRLTASARIACFGALLFAVCPANYGTLPWYSVYGHVLATTFVLAALLLLAPSPEDRAAPLSTRRAVAVACCMLAASQSFGTGVAAAILAPVVAALVWPLTFRDRGAAAALLSVPVLVGVAMAALYLPRTHLNPVPMFWVRTFEGSFVSWRLVAPMIGHLLSLGIVSLVLGAAYPLERYPDAVSAATTAAFGIGMLWALRRGSSRARRSLLAFLALAFACYAMVALGRARLYAAIQPAALVHAYVAGTRYHYLAQSLLAVVLCLVLAEASRQLSPTPRTTSLLLVTWVVWSVTSAMLLRPSIGGFDAIRDLVARQREGVERDVLARPPGATVCVPYEPAPLAIGFPGSIGVFMLYHRDDTYAGRRVYFVSSDPRVLAMREWGGRLRSLLPPAGSCPPSAG